jgi:hypothetical protein
MLAHYLHNTMHIMHAIHISSADHALVMVQAHVRFGDYRTIPRIKPNSFYSNKTRAVSNLYACTRRVASACVARLISSLHHGMES